MNEQELRVEAIRLFIEAVKIRADFIVPCHGDSDEKLSAEIVKGAEKLFEFMSKNSDYKVSHA